MDIGIIIKDLLNGDRIANENLNNIYLTGDNTCCKSIYDKLKSFADDGNIYAQYYLTTINHHIKYSFDLSTEFEFYRKLVADQELVDSKILSYALKKIGDMFYFGLGTKQDYSEAIKYYKLSIEKNNAIASSDLAYMYLQGYGVVKNIREAIKYYQLSSNQGYSIASLNLSIIYGCCTNGNTNYYKAVKYYWLSNKQHYGHIIYCNANEIKSFINT